MRLVTPSTHESAGRIPIHELAQACLRSAGSTGNLRRRFPVAARIAFVTAGTMTEVPGSPIPPGASVFLVRYTSMAGASFMRRTR